MPLLKRENRVSTFAEPMRALRSGRSAEPAAMRHRAGASAGLSAPDLSSACANPLCRSGWLHLWRSRRLRSSKADGAVRRNVRERSGVRCAGRWTGAGRARESHRHRIPLGLVMLEQGWITSAAAARGARGAEGAGTGGWASGW